MKVIIAVSRNIISYDEVCIAVQKADLPITEVLCWITPDVVTLGEKWAIENGIPLRRYEAERVKYGDKAGRLRATKMAREADALIAVWDGKTRSVRYLMNAALDHQTNVHLHLVEGEHL